MKKNNKLITKPKVYKKGRQFVADLRPNRPVRQLDLIMLRIYPRRLIYSESYTGPVAAACGRDETGLVGLILWNEQIDKIRNNLSKISRPFLSISLPNLRILHITNFNERHI